MGHLLKAVFDGLTPAPLGDPGPDELPPAAYLQTHGGRPPSGWNWVSVYLTRALEPQDAGADDAHIRITKTATYSV